MQYFWVVSIAAFVQLLVLDSCFPSSLSMKRRHNKPRKQSQQKGSVGSYEVPVVEPRYSDRVIHNIVTHPSNNILITDVRDEMCIL